MTRKTAVITGITGQDGSYLADLLLDKDYRVIGIARRCSVDNTERIRHCMSDSRFVLVEGDIVDYPSMSGIIREYKPDEFYNLAAQSHVGTSFKQPCYTLDVCAKGVLNILECIRTESPQTRFYQASTSELFGNNFTSYGGDYKFQNEQTAFKPTSPYAAAKLAAHNLVRIYRDGYGLHASAGILFNHESERRGEKFVTRKITKWIAEFNAARWIAKAGCENYDGPRYLDKDQGIIGFDAEWLYTFPMLRLGNLDACRDWGHAEDYVRMMWMMLQADQPDDYVIATGETHSIREFLDVAFNYIGIDDWEPFVIIDPEFYRPVDVQYLLGDARKAKAKLGWEPKIGFEQLVKRMIDGDKEIIYQREVVHK